MKDSPCRLLCVLPAGWTLRRLKYGAAKIGSGKTPRGGAESYVKGGVLFLRSQNIHFDGLRLNDVAFIDDVTDAEMAASRVKEGDVLLNITGASLGRCCVARLDGREANVNQHVCVIRPRTRDYLSEYLGSALASAPVQAQIFGTENGISRDALNFNQIGSLLLPIPPLNVQKDIAQFIRTESADADRMIEKSQGIIDLLREHRTALISAAVTGKIDVREGVPA